MTISNSDIDVLECDYSYYKMDVSPTPKSLPQIHCGCHKLANIPNAFEGGSGLQNLIQNSILGRCSLWFLLDRKCWSFDMFVSTVHSQRHISGLLQCTVFSWDNSFLKTLFYWSVVALQCRVSVCGTVKWLSSMYTYIPSSSPQSIE